MMRRLAVSSEAELEIFEATFRYEGERTGLGFRFEAAVNAVFVRLLENPFQFPEIDEGARRALVRQFPYGVFFTVDDELITVLAVLPASASRGVETRTRRPWMTNPVCASSWGAGVSDIWLSCDADCDVTCPEDAAIPGSTRVDG